MKAIAAYPMTEVQKGIAYECYLNKDREFYISQMTIELYYENIEIYKAAWEKIIDKYETFKTAFYFGEMKDDVQVVNNHIDFKWEVLTDYNGSIESIEEKERKRLSDIKKPTLIRFKHINNNQKNYLIITFHHIILDGWSLSIVLNDVNRLYYQLFNEEKSYIYNNTEFSEFIQNKLTANNEKSNQYFQNLLTDFPGFSFPSLTPIEKEGFETINKILTLDMKVIKNFCKKYKISLSSLFSSVWSLVVSAYTGKSDILLNKTHSGRDSKKKEQIVGLLIENYPSRYKIYDDEILTDFIENNHITDIETREKQEFSMYQAKKYLSDIGVNEYTNCAFVYENYPVNESKSYKILNTFEKQSSELTLSAGVMNDQVLVKMMFSLELINKDIASALIESYTVLLSEVLKDEKQTISEVINKIRLSKAFGEVLPVPKDIPLITHIEERVQGKNDNIAFYYNNNEINYNTLINETKRYSSLLNDLELSYGETVAIDCDRAPYAICLMLALEQHGIPFVYLDSKNTSERNRFILNDSNASYLFYDKKKPEYISDIKIRGISISSKNSFNFKGSNEYLTKNKREDYFQIIYTSGTTGNPKGIKITTNNIFALSINNGFYDVKEGDIFTQASSLAFDACFFEIWLPLLNNGSIAFIPDPVFDVLSWKEVLNKYNITASWFTSSLFNVFIDLDPYLFSKISNVFVGGEALSRGHVLKALSVNPNTNFFNGYGPTENTTFTTTYKIPTDYSERSAISIGSLLANSEAVVVDDSNRIVPIYSQGELLVRGKGLSKGYVENKVNDNKNFLVEINEQTYYRTGDIVSFDGQRFHYIDRKDSQVKINGYRVEVLEIENRIKEIIGVKNAKVMIGEDKLITLFYTGGISKRELKSTLANKFPSYMNPKLVYQIKTMPLTINGKIDKDKLLTIKNDNDQENLSEIKVVAPKLSDIILKYTDSKNIESDASFHDLGIDSMKTIRLNKELNKIFNLEVSLKDFVQFKTINDVQECYMYDFENEFKQSNGKYLGFATNMQKSMYYYQLEHPENTMFNIPYVRKILKTDMKVSDLNNKVKQVIGDHNIFNSALIEDKNSDLIWVTQKKNFEIEHIFVPGQFDKNKIITYLNHSFNLSDGLEPLMKVTLIEEKSYIYLIFVVHHIIFDGISLEKFISMIFDDEHLDNTNNYFQYLSTKQDEKKYKKDKEFWMEKVVNIENYLRFYKKEFNHQGEMQYFDIPEELGVLIELFSQKNNISKFNLCLKLYSQFLLNYFNEDAVYVGTPLNKRTEEYKNTIGLFIEFLPVLDKKSNINTFKEDVQNFKLELFDLYDHSDIEFQDINNIQATRNNYEPITQTTFAMQTFSEKHSNEFYDDLIIKNHKYSQFPLSLTIYEFTNCLKLQVDYATELFASQEIKSLIDLFLIWSKEVLLKSDICVSDIIIRETKKEIIPLPTENQEEFRFEQIIYLVNENNYDIQILDENSNEIPENEIANVFLIKLKVESSNQKMTENINKVHKCRFSDSRDLNKSMLNTRLKGFKSGESIFIKDNDDQTFKDIIPFLNCNMKKNNVNESSFKLNELILSDVKEAFKKVFKIKNINNDDSFLKLGGDSIKNIQIISALRKKNYVLSTNDLLNNPSVSLLTKHLQKNIKNNNMAVNYKYLQKFKLNIMQQWFMKKDKKNFHHFNQSFFENINIDVTKDELLKAFKSLYSSHAMLRAVILEERGELFNYIQEIENLKYEQIFIECKNEKEFYNKAKQADFSLDIYNGPTSKILYFFNNQKNCVGVYFVCHHMFVDTFSINIIRNEINDFLLYTKRATGDISNTELLNKKIQNLPSINTITNQKNLIYSSKSGVISRNISIENSKYSQVNFPKILASSIIKEILTDESLKLDIAVEKDSRLSESLKDFNLSDTVGWYTEIYNLDIQPAISVEEVYLILQKESDYKFHHKINSQVFLNVVNLEEAHEYNEFFIFEEIQSIAEENIQSMPPTINIIKQGSNLMVSVMNIKNCEEHLLNAIHEFNCYIQNVNYLRYFADLKVIGNPIIPFKEYAELINQKEIEEIYPLFPLQEEMLYSSVGDYSQSYINEISWTTKTNMSDIIESFSKVHRKYQALRTKFWISDNGSVYQVIKSSFVELPIKIIDLKYVDSNEIIEKMNEIKERTIGKLRDFKNGVTHYLLIITTPNNNKRIVWLFNHILFDGWSLSILINEMWNKKTILGINEVSNRDYVLWLNQNKETISESTDFQSLLSEFNGVCSNLFNNRDLLQSSREVNREVRITLEKELTNEIYKYAKHNDIKVAQIFNYLWGYIISHLSKKSKVTFGLVDSGREINVPDIENKVGLFIKTLPILFSRDEDKTIINEIKKLEEVKSNIFANVISISKLKQKLNIPSWQLLYDTLLVIENFPEVEEQPDSIQDFYASEQSNMPLSMSVGLSSDIVFKLVYSSSLISEEAIEKISSIFKALLKQVCSLKYVLRVNDLLVPDIEIKLSNENVDEINSVKKDTNKNNKICEEEIINLWEEILGTHSVSTNDDFFESGGDSLKLSKLVFLLNEKMGLKMDVISFFQDPTIQNILNNANSLGKQSKKLMKGDDIELPKLPSTEILKVENSNNHVFITGTTGLLGSELLYQHLIKGFSVYTVIRAECSKSARNRVLKQLKKISGKIEKLPLENLHVVVGDISKEFFGMSQEEYDKLSKTCSVIYNCASNVNFMAPYKEAYKSNVIGVENIMKFANNKLVKKVNHISTLSVVGHDYYLIENLDEAPISYIKTKIQAEKLLRKYRTIRNGVQISRVGRLNGNSRNKMSPSKDLFWRLILSIAQIGCCPQEFLEQQTDLTPVDEVAKCLMDSNASHNENQIINYFTKSMISFGECIRIIEEIIDKKIRKVSLEDWIFEAENSKDNHIKILIPLFKENIFYDSGVKAIKNSSSEDIGYQINYNINYSISYDSLYKYIYNALESERLL